MKKKLVKSKKKKGTAFSLKDKIIMAIAVFAITTSITAVATKAAVSLNSYSNPSPLITAAANLGTGGGATNPCGKSKDGLSCTGQCFCAYDQYGTPFYRACVPTNAYKGPSSGCECPQGCGAGAPNTAPNPKTQ
jgi:hypothetical protein